MYSSGKMKFLFCILTLTFPFYIGQVNLKAIMRRSNKTPPPAPERYTHMKMMQLCKIVLKGTLSQDSAQDEPMEQ
jgi:hypothetical protein